MRRQIGVALLLTGLLVLAGCTADLDRPNSATETTTAQTTATTTPSNGTLDVHFINVGQSVSTLIIGPTGETMLIDTGHYRDDGEHVINYLQRHGITRIDYLIVSHNDADHIGGNEAVIDYFETNANGIGAVYDPGIAASTQTYAEYLDAVEKHDVTLYETRSGDQIPFEGVDTTVLGPPEPYLENEARNENSIVLKLTFGHTSFLFTGDAEDTQERQLVETYDQHLNVTVLKAGHHGSAASTGDPLLDAATPKAVAVSSGWENQYGHPSQAVLERLSARNIPTYWTATHGDIVFTSTGEHVTIKTQRAAPTEPLALRNGDPIDPGATIPVKERTRIHTTGGDQPTPTTTTTVADGGTTPGALAVADVHADAAGTEAENLNDEYIVLENTGDQPVAIGGWTVTDAAGTTYTFPANFTLDAGATVTLHTGHGTDTTTDLYWNRTTPVWNNDGDTIIVTTDTGTEVLQETY